jgi:LPXTG-motif cell wall-anchored protein
MYNLPHTGLGSVLLAVVGLAMTAAGALAGCSAVAAEPWTRPSPARRAS